MPRNECNPMDERLKFIARLLDDGKMAPMCREFGISRPHDPGPCPAALFLPKISSVRQ